MTGLTEDSVRFAHSGPSQRILRGLRPLVSVGPLPLPMSGGGHASVSPVIPYSHPIWKCDSSVIHDEYDTRKEANRSRTNQPLKYIR